MTAAEPSERRPERRILVLDDAPLERAIFARYAAREGWLVAGEAAETESALAALRASRPDVVVLDGRLPPAGGLALLPSLLAERPGLPVLIVVAFEEAALLRQALRLGAAGGLQRPLLPTQVAEQLRRLARTLPAGRE
jgi:DNA-binding NarL/FixJ family response regulator